MKLRLTALAVASLLTTSACKEIAGESAESFVVDDQFVIVNNGYAWHRVTWVVVRNWPKSSHPQDRLKDERLVLDFNAPSDRLIRLPNGRQVSPDKAPHVYFFDGQNVTIFPITMSEDDWIGAAFNKKASYKEVLAWFRRFEVHPPPRPVHTDRP
jgi:hypothetical protein